MKVIIFDLDGTLANIDHRRHFVTNGNHDWKSFNHPDNIILDEPNLPIIQICHSLYMDYLRDIIHPVIVTGRMENLRSITDEWLKKYGIAYHKMFMRKNDDYRPDYIIKEEILKEIQSQGDEIIFAVDDRKSVLEMWQRNNIFTLDVGQGKGDF